MKTCRKCETVKSVEEFYRDSTKADGRARWCKACELAAPRKYRLTCADCGRQIYGGRRGSLPQGQARCQPCRRQARPQLPPRQMTLTFPCTQCGRPHRGSRAHCYNCRRPSGWTASLSGDPAHEKAEQARERAKWKPTVDAGRAYCQQGVPGNGSSGTCVEASRWIRPGTRWCVGHSDDRSRRIGPVHHRCNLLDASTRGGIAKKAKYGNRRGGQGQSRRSLAL